MVQRSLLSQCVAHNYVLLCVVILMGVDIIKWSSTHISLLEQEFTSAVIHIPIAQTQYKTQHCTKVIRQVSCVVLIKKFLSRSSRLSPKKFRQLAGLTSIRKEFVVIMTVCSHILVC
jgi:hypothetical protein